MTTTTIDWYRITIEKETLRQLTARRDLRGWIQSGSFLLIWVVLTALAVYFFLQRWWLLMVAACYVHALFVNMISMAAAVHELSHGTPFKSKAPNEFFLYLFCFLTWNNPIHYRASHILTHHQYTVYKGLDKENIQGPVKEKLNWVNVLSWLTFDWEWFTRFIRTNVRHALGNGDVDFFFREEWDPLFRGNDPRRRAMITWARIVVIGYLLLIAAFLVLNVWVAIFLVFSTFFARILANVTGVTQHIGLGSDIPDWRMVCHTVKLKPVLRFLYWNMNYHTEHHMYAAVPFFNLPKLRMVMEKDLPEAHSSLFACIRKLYEIRKVQEKDPAYVWSPTFPPGAAPPRLTVPTGL